MSNSPQSQNHTYSILDAARIFGELDTAQQLQTNFLSLYMGQSEELLSSVAPYLFSYQPDSEFGKWLLEKGWGNSWGMFVETTVSLEDLRKHFRKFLLVKTEEGKELYFRFYDPRVLRIFLPTCDEQQLIEFFGPIKMFAMESEDPEFAIQFEFENGKLISKQITKEHFWNKLNGKQDSNNEQIKINPTDEPNNPFGGKWSFLVD